jgi:hypothetical protein
MQYHNSKIVCLQETHLHPAYSLNFHVFITYHYYHLDSDRVSGRTAVLIKVEPIVSYHNYLCPSFLLKISALKISFPDQFLPMMGRIFSDVFAGFNLLPLSIGTNMHICLG